LNAITGGRDLKSKAVQALGPLLIGLQGPRVTNEEREWLRHPAVGGVVLFTRNYVDKQQLGELTGEIVACAARDLLICVDHEGGRVQRFRKGFTSLPPLAVLGRMHAESPALANDFAYRHGRVMATELLLCGVDLSFAPVLDIGARSIVIGERAFAAQPAVIIELARAYIAGMHDAGMSATGKHFPGHGSVVADSHTGDVNDPRPFEEIRELDLQPFAVLSRQMDAVMMAHVMYPLADQFPAGYSKFWIQTVLRQQLNFNGTVFSDDLGMVAAQIAGDVGERVDASLRAGCDAVLLCKPGAVRLLLATTRDGAYKDAGAALRRLKGRLGSSREELESIGEWRQWRASIEQLEHSEWI